jgi:D-beta-D-heptose 7-phosphate kinase / D-beta-D-heptose 1-phosphate adenosyltransferase
MMLHHVARLRDSLVLIEDHCARLEAWGRELAERLPAGARLITAGNGGSAAEAQHLAAELVGRYRIERAPLSAICLHAETSSLTAISNDYGSDEMFARQLRAHGRPGDVFLALSTSGHSHNLIAAAASAADSGLTTWALTGPAPNPLADASDGAVCLAVHDTATVQELHLVSVHLLCEVVDREVGGAPTDSAAGARLRSYL